MRESNWEVQREKALKRLESEGEGAREVGKADWDSRVSDAREGLRESLQSEVALGEEASEVGPEAETVRLSFTSMEEVDRAIEQHPHLEKTLSEERYDETNAYMEIIDSPEMSTRELSERLEIGEDEVDRLRAERTTTLISSLELQEEKRIEHEASVPSEALGHRIDPGTVRELACEILEAGELGTSELTDFVETLYQSIRGREKESVHYAELYDTRESLVSDRFRDLAGEIRASREDIEKELNVRLGLDMDPESELRIAVTDDRLYYWHVSTSPDRWLNVLAGEMFYLRSKEDKYELLDDLQQHLHVRGGPQHAEYYLNDILSQLGREEGLPINRVRRYGTPYYLDGEALHLIGNVLGLDLEQLKPRLSHLGMKEAGRVSNLQFPEVRRFRMRFVAIAESDCHLDSDGRLSYYEKNVERRRIAVDFFKEFGDFEVKQDQEGGKRTQLPKIYGTLAGCWDIPEGDKAIHNRGLNQSVIDDSPQVKIHYPREMVPEDGCFSGGVFSVSRGHVLHHGKKLETYKVEDGFEPKASMGMVDFVRKHGKLLPAAIGYENWERKELSISDLRNLTLDIDTETAEQAQSLLSVVYNNPNRLLDDEMKHIMGALGIDLSPKPDYLFYYVKSERLSVRWSVATSGIEQSIRWALIAPPNHPDKMKRVVEFIESKSDAVQNVKNDLEREGFEIHSDWRDYGL